MDSNQKSIPVVGFLTCNDCDVLRAKTGVYRRPHTEPLSHLHRIDEIIHKVVVEMYVICVHNESMMNKPVPILSTS